ncbi:MAG TPA: hypothetical protein VMF12_03510 [Xanthobacteraceae bacterium]|nr:hypothetical protein [Xanthobacteraceae bacterium]
MRAGWPQSVQARLAQVAILVFAAAVTLAVQIAPAVAQAPPPPAPAPTPPDLFLQSLGHIAVQTSQVGETGIQQQIWSIEDRLQSLPQTASAPLGFAEDTPPQANVVDQAFAALGYSNEPGAPQNPIAVKAPPQQAGEPSRFSYAAWTQGFVDYENRSGTFDGENIGRQTLVGGGLAGVDVTVQGLTSATDALVAGLLTGDATASVHNGDGSTMQLHGPMLGTYGAYVNGAFSADSTLKADFFDLSENSAGSTIPLGLINYVAVGNLNYKQNVGSWWVEPTVGGSYTRTVWDTASKAFGMIDGSDLRVQGGARFGAGFDWSGVHFTETLTLLAYDDVIVSGGTLAVATGVPLAPTDAGRIFGQAIGKIEAQLTKNWLLNVEGELRGRTDVYGLAGRLGLTYLFD